MSENKNNDLPNIFFKINKLYNYQHFQHSDNENSTLSDLVRSGIVLVMVAHITWNTST